MQLLDALIRHHVRTSGRSPAHVTYLWTRTRWVTQIKQVARVVERWRDMEVHRDRFGLRFAARGGVLGRIDWNGRSDVRLPTPVHHRLVTVELAEIDPDGSQLDQIGWRIRSSADVCRAVSLLRIAYLALNESRTEAASEDAAHSPTFEASQ